MGWCCAEAATRTGGSGLVELTDCGKAFIEEIYARHEKDLERLSAGLCEEERKTMYEGLKKIGLAAKVAVPTQKC